MAKATLSILFLVLLLSVTFGGTMNVVNGEKTWCVAKPSTEEDALQNNINYACEFVDCSVIKPNGKCYYPNFSISHASVVMNLYYQAKGRKNWNCNFTDSGLTAETDPSYGDCKYA